MPGRSSVVGAVVAFGVAATLIGSDPVIALATIVVMVAGFALVTVASPSLRSSSPQLARASRVVGTERAQAAPGAFTRAHPAAPRAP